MLPALHYRDFRLLLASSFLSYASVWMQRLVVSWLILELTDSAVFLGVAFAARALPNLLFGAFGGTISDRVNRKYLVAGVQLSSAVLSLLMGALVLAQDVNPWQVIAFSFCYGAIQSFDVPSRQALVYDLTSRDVLMNALSLNEVGRRFTAVLGPLLSGVLIETIGIGRVFLWMSAMSALGMIAIAAVRTPPVRIPAREAVLHNLIEGVRVIARNQITATLVLLTMACEVFAFSYAAMMPIFASDVLHLDASGYGYLTAAAGLGTVVGAIGLASLGEYQHKGWLLTGAFLSFGVFLVAFSTSTWFGLSLVLLVGVGVASCAFDTLQQTLLQKNVPEEMRGRALGAWVLAIGMGPIGTMYLGLMAGHIGAPMAVGLNGALVVAMAVAVAMGLPRIRGLS
ncbi:MAG: MFS transporter [Chloroflexi bacterium]|nr:MFS transporter [Chloroflexota bacterium]